MQIDHSKDSLVDALGLTQKRANALMIEAGERWAKTSKVSEFLLQTMLNEDMNQAEKAFIIYQYGLMKGDPLTSLFMMFMKSRPNPDSEK